MSDHESDPQAAIRDLVANVLDAIEADGPQALEAACERHPESADVLRRRVRALAAAGLVELDPARTQILDDPGGGSSAPDVAETLGPYRLIETLGVGGMGVVYRAVDPARDQTVALKVIRPELLYFPGARARFRRETDVVSRLHDPGIIAVHEVGEADGVPFLAMELVDGQTLEQVISAGRRLRTKHQPLTAEQIAEATDRATQAAGIGSWLETCLAWTARIARSLDHAHERGVLHRDIKPSNLMLARDGRLLVMDFGLAAAEGTGSLTRTGTQLGSLPYMAPELLLSGARDATARSDVYSLGVVLYELLALEAPFGAGNTDAVRDLVLAANPTPLRAHDPSIPRDVATVVAKAMDRDPSRRYPTMERLAADLDNLRAGNPIHARPSSVWLKLARSARRHPTRYTAAILGVALLVAAPLMHVVGARSERDAAVWNSYRAQLSAAAVSLEVGDPSEARRHLAECPEHLRGWTWRYLNHRVDTSLLIVAEGLPPARELICPGPRTAIASFEDGSLRGFDLKRRSERYRLATADAEYVSLTQTKRRFLAARVQAGQPTRIERREILSGKLHSSFELDTSDPVRLLHSRRGDRLIVVYPDRTLCQLDVRTGAELDRWQRRAGTSVAGVASAGVAYYADDGRLAVRLPSGKSIRLVEEPTSTAGRHYATTRRSTVLWAEMRNYLAQVVDGQPVLVTLNSDAFDQGRLVHRFTTMPELGRAGSVTALGSDEPGLWITTGHERGPVLIWASYRAQLERRLLGHTSAVTALAWIPGQRELMSASRDGTLRLWPRKPMTERRKFRPFSGRVRRSPLEQVTALGTHPASRQVALGTADGTIEIVDGLDGCRLATLMGHTRAIGDVSFRADGQQVASVSDDGTVRVWDIQRQMPVVELPARNVTPTAVAVAEGRVVVADANGELTAWSNGTLTDRGVLGRPVRNLWLDGSTVLGRAVDGTRFRWTPGSAPRPIPDALPRLVASVSGASGDPTPHKFAVLENQKRAAIAAQDGSVHFHETEHGEQLLVIPAPKVGTTTDLEFGAEDALLLVDRGLAVETLPVVRLDAEDLNLLRQRDRLLLSAVHLEHSHSQDTWDAAVVRQRLLDDTKANPAVRELTLHLLDAAGPTDWATAEQARRNAVNQPRNPAQWQVALRELRRVLPKLSTGSARRRAQTTEALLFLRTGEAAAATAAVARLEQAADPTGLPDPLLPLIEGLAAMAVQPADLARAKTARARARSGMQHPQNRRMAAATILLAELDTQLESK